jgi:thiol-disulfide isomerase/thioredoxin
MRLMRFLTISSLLVTASLSMAQSLNVGDNAPELKVTDWVKGSPQTLGNGNVTVVEFWATWCGPCKMSIPHLTEMAKKYKGKVNFVGVSIWEAKPEDYKTKVPAFVKDFGDKMDYNVATEGPDTYMAKNWMTAAGERGIPSSFLINGEGKIAWIGHPMDGLDVAIDKLLEGKLDMAAAKAERAKQAAAQAEQEKQQAKMQEKIGPLFKALQAKKYQEASDEADKVMKSDADLKPMVSQYKLMAMVQGKLSGLDTYLDSLGKEEFTKDPMMLNQIIWTVVENDLQLAPSVYKSCVKLGEKMMKAKPADAMNMDTYALSLWRAGDKKKALATQKKAVELASGNKEIPADTVDEMKARLKEFGG